MRACYDNQIGCIIRTTTTINDEKLNKIDNMRPSLLNKVHQIFLFPGRNEKDYKYPDKDPAMKKINKHAMTKFSDALAAWKVRVKRAIDKKEPDTSPTYLLFQTLLPLFWTLTCMI